MSAIGLSHLVLLLGGCVFSQLRRWPRGGSSGAILVAGAHGLVGLGSIAVREGGRVALRRSH
jgi:hypothetical protein